MILLRKLLMHWSARVYKEKNRQYHAIDWKFAEHSLLFAKSLDKLRQTLCMFRKEESLRHFESWSTNFEANGSSSFTWATCQKSTLRQGVEPVLVRKYLMPVFNLPESSENFLWISATRFMVWWNWLQFNCESNCLSVSHRYVMPCVRRTLIFLHLNYKL